MERLNPGGAWIGAAKPGLLLRQLRWTCATANRVAPALHDHFLSTCARAAHNTFQWIDSIRHFINPPHSSVKACCQGLAVRGLRVGQCGLECRHKFRRATGTVLTWIQLRGGGASETRQSSPTLERLADPQYGTDLEPSAHFFSEIHRGHSAAHRVRRGRRRIRPPGACAALSIGTDGC